jgi:hypothetical protein
MKIGEITDLILSEAAPYVDEALAQIFMEIEQTSQTYAEAKEKKESAVSKVGKVLKGAALAGGAGYIAHKAGMTYSNPYATTIGAGISAAAKRAGGYVGRQAGEVSLLGRKTVLEGRKYLARTPEERAAEAAAKKASSPTGRAKVDQDVDAYNKAVREHKAKYKIT